MKCDQYWPSRGTETYGSVQVTLVDVVELATYTVRTFQLARVRRRCTASMQSPPRIVQGLDLRLALKLRPRPFRDIHRRKLQTYQL